MPQTHTDHTLLYCASVVAVFFLAIVLTAVLRKDQVKAQGHFWFLGFSVEAQGSPSAKKD